ncbi:MAG TPA: tetratricopeptide repeat protein [Drouetiella sp.]|jgi:tetratricopeptide (TPR) repeat protein
MFTKVPDLKISRVDGMRRNRFLLAGSLTLLAMFAAVPLQVQAEESVTLIRHSNKAADYYNAGDYGRAREEYRIAIGLSPKSVELYEGLYNAAMKNNEWDQVAFAIEKIFELDPKKQPALSYEYGQALFHLNKYDEAVPWLKKALASADLPSVAFVPKIKNIDIVPSTPYVPPPPPKEEPKEPEPPKEPERAPETYSLSYENAVKSECIVIAEFEGLDKTTEKEASWNHPPLAHYHITKILKGPPLNKALPLKYEFHDLVDTKKPDGWKFSQKLLPEQNSSWILFIEFAVPKRGMFETFQGSYGRQPATDDNLNNLYQLLDKYNMRNPNS